MLQAFASNKSVVVVLVLVAVTAAAVVFFPVKISHGSYSNTSSQFNSSHLTIAL